MEGNTPKGERRSTALLTAYTSRNLKWNERIEAFHYAGLLNGLLATFPRGKSRPLLFPCLRNDEV